MVNLDSIDEIEKIDTSGVLQSIKLLPNQIAQAWEEISSLGVPEACSFSKNVVVSGMGGSALGGRIVDSLISERARAPIEVFTEFHLPNYINKNTLVILCSYSGDTEETLSAGREAFLKGASIFCITTGGKLENFMNENNLSGYIFDPKENPSKQPRMGLGYSIASILAVLSRCEFINVHDDEINMIVNEIKDFIHDYDVPKGTSENLAKITAKKLHGKVPILVASEHLVGAAHAFKNQLNENAKTFAALFDIPELNHHLMEGLKNPSAVKTLLHFLFFDSDFYSKEVSIRYPITIDVVGQNDISSSIYKLRSSKKMSQIFEVITFGSFVAFYLSMLYGIDPAPIPWVDYFKSKLYSH